MGLVTMIPRLMGYGKRIAKATPELLLGTGSDVIGAAARGTKGSVLTKARAGFRALEGDIAKKQIKHGGFFKRLFHNLKTTPSTIAASTKAGSRAARMAGKSTLKGGIKGFFKGVGKKMPFIGAALMVISELPNIFKATKEQGIGQGIKETVKAGARLGGGAIGAAIGSAICPGIGSLIGWVAGEWLAGKVVGKSYSEKKADEEMKSQEELIAQQEAQAQQANQQVPFTSNPYGMTNPMYGYDPYANPYANDIMMQKLPMNYLA